MDLFSIVKKEKSEYNQVETKDFQNDNLTCPIWPN